MNLGEKVVPGKQPLLFVNLTLNLKLLKPAIQLPTKMGHFPMLSR